MGDKRWLFLWDTLRTKTEKNENYHYDIIQQQNDIFNKPFLFRNQNSAINKWQLGILKIFVFPLPLLKWCIFSFYQGVWNSYFIIIRHFRT